MGKEGDDWMSNGKEFQRMDAATGIERRPTADPNKPITWSKSGKCHNQKQSIINNATLYSL